MKLVLVASSTTQGQNSVDKNRSNRGYQCQAKEADYARNFHCIYRRGTHFGYGEGLLVFVCEGATKKSAKKSTRNALRIGWKFRGW